jgi:hypothetical protein
MLTSLDKIAEGIKILIGEGANDMSAEHDVIYVSGANESLFLKDRERLEELGWIDTDDEEPGSWMRYV